MAEKEQKTLSIPYKDKDLPENNLSPERMEELEEKALPQLMEALEEYKKANPGTFRTGKK